MELAGFNDVYIAGFLLSGVAAILAASYGSQPRRFARVLFHTFCLTPLMLGGTYASIISDLRDYTNLSASTNSQGRRSEWWDLGVMTLVVLIPRLLPLTERNRQPRWALAPILGAVLVVVMSDLIGNSSSKQSQTQLTSKDVRKVYGCFWSLAMLEQLCEQLCTGEVFHFGDFLSLAMLQWGALTGPSSLVLVKSLWTYLCWAVAMLLRTKYTVHINAHSTTTDSQSLMRQLARVSCIKSLQANSARRGWQEDQRQLGDASKLAKWTCCAEERPDHLQPGSRDALGAYDVVRPCRLTNRKEDGPKPTFCHRARSDSSLVAYPTFAYLLPTIAPSRLYTFTRSDAFETRRPHQAPDSGRRRPRCVLY